MICEVLFLVVDDEYVCVVCVHVWHVWHACVCVQGVDMALTSLADPGLSMLPPQGPISVRKQHNSVPRLSVSRSLSLSLSLDLGLSLSHSFCLSLSFSLSLSLIRFTIRQK